MLHTKFQGHWSISSGEEDFLRFLPYMGMAAMLFMWSRPFEQLLFPKGPGVCIWNLVAIGPVVSEEKSFEIVDGQRTDEGWPTDDGPCLYYKLPRSLWLRWAKNQSSKTSVKYDHLQVMETITRKFHQNPLKNVGGVAETRTSVDGMAKTQNGP